MNLADLRTAFLTDLTREDCTEAQANDYIGRALRRIQREARLPCMESEVTFTATSAPILSVSIPSNLIAPLDVLVPALVATGEPSSAGGEVSLRKTSFRELQRIALTDPCQAYARQGGSIYVRGRVPTGSSLRLIYYAAGPDLTSDTDETAIMAAAPELVLFAALAYAGMTFEKPQTADWEAAYQSTLAAVDMQARDLDEMGGPSVISPAYEA